MLASGRFRASLDAWRVLLALIATLICIPLSTIVHATSVVKLSDQQMVRLSSTVAEGRVTDVRSGWSPDRTQIYTTVTIQVTRQIKGVRPQGGTLVINLLGGQAGDVVMELVGQPTFRVDEEVIVFLDATSPQYTPITGLSQGKLTVEPDATGALNVVGRGVSRDDFVSDISRMVTEQERGR